MHSNREVMDRYHLMWGPGRKPGANGIPAPAANSEDELRAKFFRSNGADALAKCQSCVLGRAPMPIRNDIPYYYPRPGHPDDRLLLPCGCDYQHALLEMFMWERGMWSGHVGGTGNPGHVTRQGRALAFAVFEECNGPFSFDKVNSFEVQIHVLNVLTSIDDQSAAPPSGHGCFACSSYQAYWPGPRQPPSRLPWYQLEKHSLITCRKVWLARVALVRSECIS